ncbi:unnamed protein product [Prunus armeniaca]|uniref:tetraacyldisaccharide 4'-kinase n=1 Tax=Prunus armeniaca TaxID=36596 RepID=A0A6J5UMV7_PRUAR|nr:unnamed protein product [Prunus armeniaca]
MQKLRKAVSEIAYAQNHAKLTHLQLCLIPVLRFASSLYKLALSLRRSLYHSGLFRKHRLPVPVISVGNLTWGGNGKTPMAEFIARFLADSGISPLILTRGYAGGDEAKMLRTHLLGRPVKIGKVGRHLSSEKNGAVILDDGMQHWSLQRDLEIVMVSGLTLWGNCHLIPCGPLREPFNALRRADVVVLHHADLIGAFNVDRLEFSNHHIFQAKDIEMIGRRLRELEDMFGHKPVVIVTEKDYDRDPEIFKHLDPYEVLALCSELKIILHRECNEDGFKKLLKGDLKDELQGT